MSGGTIGLIVSPFMAIRQCYLCDAEFNSLGGSVRCIPCRSIPDLRCKKCKRVKSPTEFARDRSRPSGLFPWCLRCSADATTNKAFQDPDDALNGRICPVDDTPIRGHANRRFCSNTCKERAGALKDKYNLTVEQFRQMVQATGGQCPVCLKRATEWHVDHDHKTQKVHGVVCSMCNVHPIAYTYHSIELVKRLLDYLENPPAEQLGIFVTANVERQSNLDKVWNRPRRKGSA